MSTQGLEDPPAGGGSPESEPAGDLLGLLRFSLDHASDAVYWTDSDGRLILVSDSACRLFGYTREELLTMTVFDLDLSLTAEERSLNWERMRAQGTFSMETSGVKKGGQVFPIEITVNHLDFAGREYNCVFARDMTERRSAELAMRESEERFRAAFMTNPAAVYIATLEEGRLIEVNPAFKEVFGYAPEEVIGQTSLGLGLYKNPADRAAIVAQLKANGTVREFEVEGVKKSGEQFTCSLSISVLALEGKPHILGIARDITAQKEAERALRESEGRYRQLFESSPDGIVAIGLDGCIMRANEAEARMFRYASPDDLVGLDATLLVAPSHRERAAQMRSLRLKGEGVEPVEYELLARDGTTFWGVTLASAIRDPDGAISGYLCTTRDTTQNKRNEEALVRSEAKFRDLTERSPFGIYVIQNNKMVYVNRNFLDVYGYAEEEVVGKMSPLDLIHDDDKARIVTKLRERLSGMVEPSGVEYKAVRKDGSVFDIEVYGVATEYEGRPAVMGSLMDVTERNRAQEALRQAEEQLRQSQKMEAIGQLAGGIAHDFNNLLTAILGYSDLMLAGAELPGPRARVGLGEIRNAAERAAALTRQILTFSRRETVETKVLSLNEVVLGVESLLRRTLGENVSLHIRTSADLAQVKADMHQLEQVIMNLAVNARDAMPSGGALAIETANVELGQEYCLRHAEVTPGDYVMLAVSDTGTGMDAATLERIFEPFYTTKPAGEGTGLGLSTVYGIVKQSNGYTSVSSELGKGTRFEIYLPRHESAEASGVANALEGPTRSGSETVLLVEDEATILTLIQTMLSTLGHKVLTAGTPGEAISLAAEHPGEIGLLMTDVVMPEMNGRDLARRLRAVRPDLKHIFMSGYAADVISDHGALEGGVHFLQKPFSLNDLAAKLQEVLGPNLPCTP